MSDPRSRYALIDGPAPPRAGPILCTAERGGGDRPARDRCTAEAPHYAALLRDLAARLRPIAARRDAADLLALADQFDDTAAALDAKEREGESNGTDRRGFS